MLGLCGAQQVGKTTLAKAFGEALGIPVIQTSTSGVFRRMGLDPKVDYPLEQRLEIQRQILDSMSAEFEAAARTAPMFVSDRTPVDMAAYMLADITRANCQEPVTNTAVLNYVQDCIDETNRHFSTLVLIQPGIKPPAPAEGKALALPAFQEHFNHLAAGLLVDPRLHRRAVFMPRDVLDLADRVRALRNATGMTLHKHEQFVRDERPVFH